MEPYRAVPGAAPLQVGAALPPRPPPAPSPFWAGGSSAGFCPLAGPRQNPAWLHREVERDPILGWLHRGEVGEGFGLGGPCRRGPGDVVLMWGRRTPRGSRLSISHTDLI